MLRRMSVGKGLLGMGALAAAIGMPAAAEAAPPPGCFFGVWMINEQLTKRTRPPRSPLVVVMAPWGENGWVRVSGVEPDSGEFQFATNDEKMYPIYGSDPRYVSIKKVDDYTYITTSIRDGLDPVATDGVTKINLVTTVSFSKDCKRMTTVRPSGPRAFSGKDNEDDTRVFDKVTP